MADKTDAQLATALKQARQTPMNFAFVAKGAAEGKLLVAKKAIPAKEVAEAKKDVGGGLVFRGRCLGEEGKLIFEVPKEPPSTLAKQLKSIISRDAGLTLQVEVRVAPDLAEEGEAPSEGAAQQQPPPPATDKAAVLKRLAALAGPYKEALARKGPDGPRLQQLFAAVKELLDKQDFERAGKVLDALEPLVARARTAPTAPPPPGDGAARFAARLKALLPEIHRAQAGTTPASQAIKARVTEANTLARNKDFDQANVVLDQVEALLKQGPGATVGETTGKQEGGLAPGLAAWQAARETVVKELRTVAAAVAATQDPDARAVIIELQAIIKNLTPSPATPQQVAELERYLREDDIITAAEEVPPRFGSLRIREPLLRALQALKA